MAAIDDPIDVRLLPRSARVDDAGRVSIGGVDLASLADEFGTPLYVYDEDELRARCAEYRIEFGDDMNAGAAFAAKAFLCVAMGELVDDEGLDLDVATGGELHVALHAGFPAERITFHGNNKSTDELRTALTVGVGRIVVDGFDEIDRIESLVADGLPRPRVMVRVTPGVEAHTHEYIATGADDSKFGFSAASGAARDAAIRVVKSTAMDFIGFHCHIGSQILLLEPYARAAEVLAGLARDVHNATGIAVEELNLGGGLGVAYTGADLPDVSTIAEFAATVRAAHAAACDGAGLD
ncbi:MAG: diaminopimelate decarboxylase, partial [Acidimicrobiia bacterium]